jgi:hypothetical protein
MTDKPHAFVETLSEREQRREREISEAIKLDEERYTAVTKMMRRLRPSRFARRDKVRPPFPAPAEQC